MYMIGSRLFDCGDVVTVKTSCFGGFRPPGIVTEVRLSKSSPGLVKPETQYLVRFPDADISERNFFHEYELVACPPDAPVGFARGADA